MTNDEFQELIWQKGKELYRDMPWRRDTRAYYVLVSELMLQQTQVERVIPKFNQFISVFPDEQTLAAASLGDVLRQWQGLGYNRRAKYLHEAAKKVAEEWHGIWPRTAKELQELPGVGPNTAGAMMAYVYNAHTVFIETNIRSVYFLHFFADAAQVSDAEVRAMVEYTLDREHPREFYWALMDYGAWLKANGLRNIAVSKHYKKQSSFHGSARQVRGAIVRALTAHDDLEVEALLQLVGEDTRLTGILASLVEEGMIEQAPKGSYRLTR